MLMECEGFWPTVSSILGWVLATPSGFCLERFLPTASFIPGWVLATPSGFLLGRFWPTLSVSGNGFKDAVNIRMMAPKAVRLRPKGAKAHSPGQATEGSGTPGYPGSRPCRPKGAKAFVRPHVTELFCHKTNALSLHCFYIKQAAARHRKRKSCGFSFCSALSLHCFCPFGATRPGVGITRGAASLRSALPRAGCLQPLRGFALNATVPPFY